MKKILFLLLAFVAFQSCVDNNTTFTGEDGVYYGNLTVGEYTEMAGISVTEITDTTVDIFFDNVKFAKAMPVRIDITVKGVRSEKTADMLSFSAVNIDPYMNKEPDPQPGYRFSEIYGVVVGNELSLSAKMADDLKGTPAGKNFAFKGVCEID